MSKLEAVLNGHAGCIWMTDMVENCRKAVMQNVFHKYLSISSFKALNRVYF